MVSRCRSAGIADSSDESRLNAKLEAANVEPMTDLVKDFCDGVKLIQVSLSVIPRGYTQRYKLYC
jgi:hypothetical protein